MDATCAVGNTREKDEEGEEDAEGESARCLWSIGVDGARPDGDDVGAKRERGGSQDIS